MRGSKLQIRCRLILLISEHPIQQGIRKGGGGGSPERDGGEEGEEGLVLEYSSSWIGD